MCFRRAVNDLSYVFEYTGFNYIVLCVKMYQVSYFKNIWLNFFISTGFCSTEQWLNLIKKNCFALTDDVHNQSFFVETFF